MISFEGRKRLAGNFIFQIPSGEKVTIRNFIIDFFKPGHCFINLNGTSLERAFRANDAIYYPIAIITPSCSAPFLHRKKWHKFCGSSVSVRESELLSTVIKLCWFGF